MTVTRKLRKGKRTVFLWKTFSSSHLRLLEAKESTPSSKSLLKLSRQNVQKRLWSITFLLLNSKQQFYIIARTNLHHLPNCARQWSFSKLGSLVFKYIWFITIGGTLWCKTINIRGIILVGFSLHGEHGKDNPNKPWSLSCKASDYRGLGDGTLVFFWHRISWITGARI